MAAIKICPDVSERDWPEDFQHENGDYMCRCIYCSKIFFGHKRRVCCKVCDEPKDPVVDKGMTEC